MTHAEFVQPDDVSAEIAPTLRVLIVEDEEDDREHVSVALRDACELMQLQCEQSFARSYDEAYEALSTTFFDILLVDLVLHGGIAGDPEGWEGLWLLQDLSEMGLQTHSAVVILSAFGTVDIASLTLSEFKALKFWNKDRDSSQLARDLAALIASLDYFGLKLDVALRGETWSSLAAAIGGPGARREPLPLSYKEASFELEHLVRRLFSGSVTSIEAERLVPGRSKAGVLRVLRRRGEAQLASSIVKYGPASDIRDESQRYDMIKEFTEGHRLGEIRGIALGRFVGVIDYLLLGALADEFMPFTEYFARSDNDAVVSSINGLFLENCALWYARTNRTAIPMASLRDMYRGNLGFTIESIEQSFAFKFGQFAHERFIEFIEVPRRLPHPVAALRTGDADIVVNTVSCPTHGDLHGDNILVHKRSGEGWLIDFADAGYGHWARDFASLECAIKFQCTPADNLERLFELEDSLGGTGGFSQWSTADATVTGGTLGRTLRAVVAIRSCARQLMEPYDSDLATREYYAALYFTTINYLRFHSRLKGKVRKNQILMAAGFALERFTQATD